MPSWLSTLLGWLGFVPKSVAPVATASASATLGLGITTDIGAIANAAGAAANAYKQVDAEMNTPAMVKAAEEADRQAKQDEFNEALRTNDFEKIRKLIANR